jgi:hypothetical protein
MVETRDEKSVRVRLESVPPFPPFCQALWALAHHLRTQTRAHISLWVLRTGRFAIPVQCSSCSRKRAQTQTRPLRTCACVQAFTSFGCFTVHDRRRQRAQRKSEREGDETASARTTTHTHTSLAGMLTQSSVILARTDGWTRDRDRETHGGVCAADVPRSIGETLQGSSDRGSCRSAFMSPLRELTVVLPLLADFSHSLPTRHRPPSLLVRSCRGSEFLDRGLSPLDKDAGEESWSCSVSVFSDSCPGPESPSVSELPRPDSRLFPPRLTRLIACVSYEVDGYQ